MYCFFVLKKVECAVSSWSGNRSFRWVVSKSTTASDLCLHVYEHGVRCMTVSLSIAVFSKKCSFFLFVSCFGFIYLHISLLVSIAFHEVIGKVHPQIVSLLDSDYPWIAFILFSLFLIQFIPPSPTPSPPRPPPHPLLWTGCFVVFYGSIYMLTCIRNAHLS